MGYTPHDWSNGEVITETSLDHLEAGVVAATVATNVTAFPFYAKGDGTTDDTTAIQTAINSAIADATTGNGGGVVLLPASTGHYRVSGTLTINNPARSYIEIVGQGSSYLQSIGTSTDPLITIGRGNTSGNFNGRVRLTDLYVMGSGYWNSNTQSDRLGVRIQQTQDVFFDNVFIGGFKRGGIYATDLWDSMFLNLQILYCGNGTSDTDYAYALRLDGATDQSNNNKFIGLHMENCPLWLLVQTGSRWNTWDGNTKFESGVTTGPSADNTTQPKIYFQEALENTFIGANFTLDTLLTKPLISAVQADTTMTTTRYVQRHLLFQGCQFLAAQANNSAAMWFTGSQTKFIGCVFNRTYGTSSQAAFGLGTGCQIVACTISLYDLNINLFRISGSSVSVKDNKVYGLTGATTGALITLDGAYDGVVYADNATVGQFDNMISSGLTYFGNGRYAPISATTKTITSGATPNVFLVDLLKSSPTTALSITGFAAGHNSKRFTLLATNGNTTLVNSATLVLQSGANVTMTTGQILNFYNDAGTWRQV